MDYAAHVAAVAREVDGLVAATAAGPADAPVPTCPGWAVTDLLAHVGEFTVFWTHVLCEGTGRPTTPWPDMPDGDAVTVADWYRGLGDSLLRELRATAPGQSVFSWVPDRQSAAFAARRCAHEIAVHRFDAEAARGAPQPIDAALAADSIEEIFVMIAAFAAQGDGTGKGEGQSVGLAPGDRPERWTMTMAPSGLAVDRSAGAADLTLSGSMSDLELVAYQRPALGEVTRTGDPAALDAWYRAFHFG